MLYIKKDKPNSYSWIFCNLSNPNLLNFY